MPTRRTMLTMNQQAGNHFWNFFFMLLGAAFVYSSGHFLFVLGRFPGLDSISLFDFALVTLASFRITRLVVYDKVASFIRAPFIHTIRMNTESGEPAIVTEIPEKGPERAIAELLSCPWCFGVWAATFVVFFYYATPFAWYPILIFAIAGLSSTVQLFANKVGWEAERAKQVCETLKK